MTGRTRAGGLARRLAVTDPPGKLQELAASRDVYLLAGIVLAVFGSIVGLEWRASRVDRFG